MKFIICGGGSGGHVSPAIAIYEALKKRIGEDSSFTFVGRRGGSENRAYELTGEHLETLKMSGVNGKSPIKAAKGVLNAIKARQAAGIIIKNEKPDVIIGTGGYVCWPMLTAATRLRIPTVIHESNAFPGLTTRLISKTADGVLLNYESASKFLTRRDNVRVVGNPIRPQFYTQKRNHARKMLGVREADFFILSFGGSLGSQRLNEVSLELMNSYSSKQSHIKHLHATGQFYFEEIERRAKKEIGEHRGCIVRPYIDDMASAMAAADVVISRSGAMTISEICAIGTASILVPSPNVADDHQTKNAAYMREAGASLMIPEEELSLRTLLDAVRRLEYSKDEREALASAAKSLAKKDAAEMIVDEIFAICSK